MSGSTSPLLRNARDLIDALAEAEALSPSELSEIIEIPRSTVYRLIEGLVAVDLVQTLPDGRAALSQRWLRLADAAQAAQWEWRRVRSAMHEVAERTGCTTYLSVLAEDRSMCIDWVQGRAVEVLMLKPGRTLPLYAGAAGRGILASLPQAERDSYLASAPFTALTPHTMTTVAELVEDVERTLASGFTLSRQDVTIGVGAIGVPVRDEHGRRSGILSLGAFMDELDRRQEELLGELHRAAASLS